MCTTVIVIVIKCIMKVIFLLYSIVHVEIIIVVIIKLYSVIIYLILRFHNPKQSKFGCWSIDLNTL